MKLRGKWRTKEVWLGGKRLSLERSLDVIEHSPTGFNWSYGGSGPAQLALAIMLELFPKKEAICLHQYFVDDVISKLPPSDFEVEIDIYAWKAEQDVERLMSLLF